MNMQRVGCSSFIIGEAKEKEEEQNWTFYWNSREIFVPWKSKPVVRGDPPSPF
jgi:hypothetical protein